MALLGTSAPPHPSGFPLASLLAAFERIRDERDWMAPIAGTVARADRALVAAAVLWCTETVVGFRPLAGSRTHVLADAPGYRRGPDGGVRRDQRAHGAGAIPSAPPHPVTAPPRAA